LEVRTLCGEGIQHQPWELQTKATPLCVNPPDHRAW
jgi:hypothetical protein